MRAFALRLSAAAAAAVCLALPSLAAEAPADTAAFMIVQGDTLWLAAPVEVVGSRVPAALPAIVRGVDLLDGDELASRPSRSVAEQLQALPSVVTGQRNTGGVQSDLSIRGSTFDQVQVLLDGSDLSDPQTGHHLMDLPVGVHDVDRLEVLPGHGSALYGSGAFGGTVNVVTKRPAGRTGGELGAMGGGNGTWSAWGSADLGDARTGGRLSVERYRTDGYDFTADDGSTVENAGDADLWSATGRLVHDTGRGEADAFVGYAERAFGALDFYAPYPSWERTRTLVASARVNHRLSDRVTLEPRLAVRRHEDRFVLIRTNPAAYTNDHVTHRYQGELRAVVDLGDRRDLAVGVEGAYEDIASTGVRGGVTGPALGDHLRRRTAAYGELAGHGGPLRWQLGGRVDLRSDQKMRTTGSAALAWDLRGPWTVRASVGGMHRVPTFTDLYYSDPANQGNPDLAAEHGWAWDAGVDYARGPWQGSAAWFDRHETDLIDWARPVGDTVWHVLNIAEGRARGVETKLAWRAARGHRLMVGWAWLERTTALVPGYEAKYGLLVPRHNITLQGTAVLPLHLEATAAFRYLERSDGPDDFRVAGVLDARLDWTHQAGWFASLLGTNLADRRVMEVPGVVLPGQVVTVAAGRRF
ncbi:MAG TPA: TonB-dependent receptor [Candidatus Krumholzibacteria bacterium]|nr:TonB-dependent receptor [Candidatus Krumholzibacteria bacterium]